MGFTKPLSLGLAPLVDAYQLTTFILDPAKELAEYDFEKDEDIRSFYKDNGVFAVGKFSARNLVEFEKFFGRSLDKAMATWFTADLYEVYQNNPEFREALEEMVVGVKYDSDTNTYTTPTGKLETSPQIFALQVLAFIFSQYGQVTDIDKRGEYVLEPVSYDVMLDIISPDVAFAPVGETGATLFQTVAKLIRGFSMDDLVEEVVEEVVEGEPKPKNASRRTKGSAK